MARAKKKPDVFQWDRSSLRVQSLGGGSAVRIFDHEGHARTLHIGYVDSGGRLVDLIDDVRAVDVDCADRIVSQLPDVWIERYAEAFADRHAAEFADNADVEVAS